MRLPWLVDVWSIGCDRAAKPTGAALDRLVSLFEGWEVSAARLQRRGTDSRGRFRPGQSAVRAALGPCT